MNRTFNRGWRTFAAIVFAFVCLGVILAGVALNSNRNAANTVTLTNQSGAVTASRYDTLESPQGTGYQVGSGKTLYINRWQGWPDTTGLTIVNIRIGYGDTVVHNSVSAPTNAITVYDATFPANSSPTGAPFPVFIPIPAGKYAWASINGAFNIQAVGVVQ